MKMMFENILIKIKKGEPKKIVTIQTNLFESTIAAKLSIIQEKYNLCSIGSYPYFNYVTNKGGVNIVISSWSLKKFDDIINEIEEMISLLGGKSLIV